jgi:hypothetical protein
MAKPPMERLCPLFGGNRQILVRCNIFCAAESAGRCATLLRQKPDGQAAFNVSSGVEWA